MRCNAVLMLSAGLALAISGPAIAGSVVLTAQLDGASEVQAGDPDGSGRFSAEFGVDTGDLCYILASKDIASATAAHIHQGASGANGKPVITLEVTGEDEDLCIAVEPDTLKPIVAEPEKFYVNIHTADFPQGAIRGQLSRQGE